MATDSLIEKVKNHVNDLFLKKNDSRLVYHSLGHTLEVAEAVQKIGKATGLNEDELEIVTIAALFHDTGYLIQHTDHETASMKCAEDFLSENGYERSKIKGVISCIDATRLGATPGSEMEKVMRDADYINLSNDDDGHQAELLKREVVNFGGAEASEEDWLRAELKFLSDHKYYTNYGKKKLQERKDENIKKIKKKLKKYKDSTSEKDVKHDSNVTKVNLFESHLNEPSHNLVYRSTKDVNQTLDAEDEKPKEMEKIKDEEEKKDKKDNVKKEDKPKDKDEKKEEEKIQKSIEKQEAITVKSFESIYRTSSANQMRLNAIADRKANLMLTLNGIVISITVSVVASDPDTNARLIIPTSILILVCLATIVFATLSTRPQVSQGSVNRTDIENRSVNLLYFGNIAKMEYEEFDYGIRQMITDKEFLHNSMIKDFHSLGQILDKKFYYLRICYNVFMYGIIATVISMAVLIIMGY